MLMYLLTGISLIMYTEISLFFIEKKTFYQLVVLCTKHHIIMYLMLILTMVFFWPVWLIGFFFYKEK